MPKTFVNESRASGLILRGRDGQRELVSEKWDCIIRLKFCNVKSWDSSHRVLILCSVIAISSRPASCVGGSRKSRFIFYAPFIKTPMLKHRCLVRFLVLLLAGTQHVTRRMQPSSKSPRPRLHRSTAIPSPASAPFARKSGSSKLGTTAARIFRELAPKQHGAIVFFGDSITQGWGDDFRGKFPKLNVANRGISGDITRGLLARLDEDVLALSPRAIVLLIGTNDIGRNISPQGYRRQHRNSSRPNQEARSQAARRALPGDASERKEATATGRQNPRP